MKHYDEASFEHAIEHYLTQHSGYVTRESAAFDKELALDTQLFCEFVRASQPQTWNYLESLHKNNAPQVLIKDLVAALDSEQHGCLHVLRHGFKCYGKSIKAAFFQPATGMNAENQKRYAQNTLSISRQVHYSPKHNKSIDVLLSINGIPLVTMELKNPLTKQNYLHAIGQYKRDRAPSDRLFQFKKRALVHFALDSDEVYMTTKLAKTETVFLPFNKGRENGRGNPDNPRGHKTAYLWEEVLERHSLLEIVSKFLHLDKGKKNQGELMIFPRYHQLDVVRKLLAVSRKEGAGHNYLVQHSAGSGKSHSIAWTAHRLASLHNEKAEKVFSSVIVVTDRRVLDQQLQETIYQFEHQRGLVEKIDKNSAQLAQALISGSPIIVTTIQKFPFVVEKVADVQDKTYAVIVDEAHSSMGRESVSEMKSALKGALADHEVATNDDEYSRGEALLIQAVEKRGHQKNISFFAFTATPKYKTLHLFGRHNSPHATADPSPAPFHLYSMKQAIEEGFILDVLKNYITYKTYFKLVKNMADDPIVDAQKARKALMLFVRFHEHNIAEKVEVIVEHFREHVANKLQGQAKAMLVTSSRLHALRYKKAMDAYIEKYGDMKTLVAFSGSLNDEGEVYTEVEVNKGIREKELPEKFASAEYKMLIVANKYQTGFDQPRLCAMYVDKVLGGVQAVQTLSRLNRTFQGKTETFILDFVNSHEQIQKAFNPYYEQTMVGDEIDHHKLYERKTKLESFQVYSTDEVNEFWDLCVATKSFENASQAQQGYHGHMHTLLDKALSRFSQLDDEKQEDFVSSLVSFRNLYLLLAQIIPFQDVDLEKLSTYLRFLHSKLPKRNGALPLSFDDDATLQYYRLQKEHEDSIVLETNENTPIYGHTDTTPAHKDAEEEPLSEIIASMNTRFGTEFTKSDEYLLDSVHEDAVQNTSLQASAKANSLDNFRHSLAETLEVLFYNRMETMEQNEKFTQKFFNDKAFKEAILDELTEPIYEAIHSQ